MQQEPVTSLKEKIEHLTTEVERLRGIIILLNRGKWGSTSERVTDLDSAQLMFNEIENEAGLLAAPDEMETITYDRKNGHGQKKPFP